MSGGEVITRELRSVNTTLSGQQRPDQAFLHAGIDDIGPGLGLTSLTMFMLDLLPLLLPHLSEVADEGVVVPHVLLGQSGAPLPVLVFLLYGVITQVD